MPRQRKAPLDFQFGGFDAPRYTPTPDQLFDELLAPGVLTNPELRVLLYLVRRTFGFKRDADTVSLGQIVHGIVTREGKRLDWGAGVAKSSAIEAVQGLEDKGIIVVTRASSVERGFETNAYHLRLRGESPSPLAPPGPPFGLALSVSRTRDGKQGGQALVRIADTQETAVQETVNQDDSNPPAREKITDEGGQRPTYSPYIAGTILDYSRELGDGAHGPANVAQALRLWYGSGLDESAFVEQLHEAKRRLRLAQAHGVGNKMAYYFRIVEDLVGGGNRGEQ